MKPLKKVPSDKKGLGKLPTPVRNKMGYMKKGGKVYKAGGKAPVDPPNTSPESKSKYRIGDMNFQGEEADRLIAFKEHLDNDFSNLDLFQKTEQVEKFINSKGHKSSESMKAYNVDPNLKNAKSPSLKDDFESAFGDSPFGGSDPFADDPDIKRMKEEAAARDNKKGRRKKFTNGGKVLSNYKKGGKVKKKGMTTDERKLKYMGSVYDKQDKEQINASAEDYVKVMASRGYSDTPYDERNKQARSYADYNERKREKNIYKPARAEASKRFDKNTRYDDLLGRATNPDKKYEKGGKFSKPHNMYKDGKSVIAKTIADHLKLKKQGYNHKKP